MEGLIKSASWRGSHLAVGVTDVAQIQPEHLVPVTEREERHTLVKQFALNAAIAESPGCKFSFRTFYEIHYSGWLDPALSTPRLCMVVHGNVALCLRRPGPRTARERHGISMSIEGEANLYPIPPLAAVPDSALSFFAIAELSPFPFSRLLSLRSPLRRDLSAASRIFREKRTTHNVSQQARCGEYTLQTYFHESFNRGKLIRTYAPFIFGARFRTIFRE